MVAIALIYGTLTAEHYEDKYAQDPRVDKLRDKMIVFEDKQYSKDYLDENKRSIANRIQIFFKDNTSSAPVSIEYPIGHLKRRKDGISVLEAKCRANLASVYSQTQIDKLLAPFKDVASLSSFSVNSFMELWSLPAKSAL